MIQWREAVFPSGEGWRYWKEGSMIKAGALGQQCPSVWRRGSTSWAIHRSDCRGASVSPLDPGVRMSFPGWQYSMCTITHQCQESNPS